MQQDRKKKEVLFPPDITFFFGLHGRTSKTPHNSLTDLQGFFPETSSMKPSPERKWGVSLGLALRDLAPAL